MSKVMYWLIVAVAILVWAAVTAWFEISVVFKDSPHLALSRTEIQIDMAMKLAGSVLSPAILGLLIASILANLSEKIQRPERKRPTLTLLC